MSAERLVVLAGEPEYDAHITMRPVAKRIAAELGLSLDYRVPSIIDDEPAFPESSFGPLDEALDGAAALVVYTRFRRLPEAEMRALERYLERGGSVLGLRTSSHAFRFASDSPWVSWNDGFGRDVLGSPWIEHHGHSSSTDVTVIDGAEAEIVAGLPAAFHARSWLYQTALEPWCTPVLWGVPVVPEREPIPGPVAWTGEHAGRRSFYTSLGHPDDLAEGQPLPELLVSATRWVIGGDSQVNVRDGKS